MESVAGTTRVVVERPDGRTVEAFVGPDSDGLPLVFHHGTPGCGRPLSVLVDAARVNGWRWVSISRPGFAGSTRLPGRRVADIAADTAAVLDHLGMDRCVVAGWSGGGPHALACGARLADRVDGVLVIAGSAPYPAEGLDWTAGMSESETIEARAAIDDPERLRHLLEPRRTWYGTAAAGDFLDALVGRFSDRDIGAIAPHAEEFVACIAAAVDPGTDGWLDDWCALVGPWGFAIADVAGPVVLWHGDRDESCPPAHARWLHERLPRSILAVQPGQGHLAVGVSHSTEMFHSLRAAVDNADPPAP